MKSNLLKTVVHVLLIFISTITFSQSKSEDIQLWTAEIPGAINSETYKEVPVIQKGITIDISKVSIPTLTVFSPEKPNDTAVVICPGGAYSFLAINKEGFKVAQWLNTLGITAFVLKYRLPNDAIMKDKTIGALQDAQESIRYIRRNASKWNINIEKVGIIGFSAGGHLASTLSTHYNDVIYTSADAISAKPNFSILVYPVISVDEKMTHKGSKNNLLGIDANAALIEKYSNEKQIDALTPPTFIVHAIDDKTVLVENSIQYFLGLRKNNVPAEMHLTESGKHGFGLGREGTTSQNWTKQCEEWLKFKNLLELVNNSK